MKKFKLSILASCLFLSVLLVVIVLAVIIVLVIREGNHIKSTWVPLMIKMNNASKCV